MNNNPFKYEDKVEVIDNEIRKRFYKWHLTILPWIDYEDVSQIIRIHIYKKWDLWDQQKPLEPWLNKIISNQIKNLLRNHYSNYLKPCIGCKYNQADKAGGEELCSFTASGTQSHECGDFKKWAKNKRDAFGVKVPVPIEGIDYKNYHVQENDACLIKGQERLNIILKRYLSEKHYFIYKMFFIDHIDEYEIAKILGYKTNEAGRKAGYKQIKNLKNMYKDLVKRIIDREDVFI